jgi:hypothetical protein
MVATSNLGFDSAGAWQSKGIAVTAVPSKTNNSFFIMLAITSHDAKG